MEFILILVKLKLVRQLVLGMEPILYHQYQLILPELVMRPPLLLAELMGPVVKFKPAKLPVILMEPIL